jgi:carboxypeptidase family protein/TonB-dependent receptor-like protein
MADSRRWSLILLGAWLMLWPSVPGRAQTVTAQLSGIVRDPQGQPLPEVKVVLTARDTGFSWSTRTDSNGAYIFLQIPPGSYSVKAQAPGFADAEAPELRLRLQDKVVEDLVLRLNFQQDVVVQESAPLLNVQTTDRLGHVDTEAIESLPQSGRVYTDLALLFPGVFPSAHGTFFGERPAVLTFSGQSARANSFLVDGLDNNDNTLRSRSNSLLSQEVIGEFQVLKNNFSAEFGRAAGGVLNIVTRSGTNESEVHGFFQLAPQSLGAVDPFLRDLASRETGDVLTSLSREQSGLFVSGPIVRNRAFYLLNYEQSHEHSPVGFQGAEFSGDPSPGGIFEAPFDEHNLFAKADWQISSQDLLSVRASYDTNHVGGLNVGGTQTPSSGSSLDERDFQLAGNLSTLLGTDELNEARLLVSLSRQDQKAASSDVGEDHPSSVRGGAQLQRQLRNERQFELLDNLTLIRGEHVFKAGIDLRRIEVDLDVALNDLGLFIFQNDTPFREGDPSTYALVFEDIVGKPKVPIRNMTGGLFVEDQWSASDRFVLNLGLRYDLESYLYPSDLALPTSLVPNGHPSRDWNNLGPRLSFSFRPWADKSIAIKGGGGIFYDSIALGFPAISAVTSGQKLYLAFLPPFGPDFVRQHGFEGVRPFLSEETALRFGVSNELQTPSSHQETIGVELEPLRDSLLTLYFAHAEGKHLLRFVDENAPIGSGPEGPVRPDPAFGPIAMLESSGGSVYNAFELYFQHQGPRASASVAYTLSRAEDDITDPLLGGIYVPSDSRKLGAEWGRALNDERHRLVVSGSLRWPAWHVEGSTILTYGSGLPFDVTTGLDDNSDGQTTDRPPGITRDTGAETPLPAVNAYRARIGLPPFTGSLSEPDSFTWDVRLSKDLQLKGLHSKLFVQVFNLTNRQNFGGVVGSVISPFFGRPSTLVTPPRHVELGIRLLWQKARK